MGFDRQMPDVSTQRELTKDVRDYFLSDEVFAHYERIASEYGLDDDNAVSTLSALVYRFVVGTDTIKNLQRQIQLEFLLTESKAEELISSVFLHIVSPVANEIIGLSDEIKKCGENSTHIESQMTPKAFIQFFITAYSEELDAVERHRLENILLSYANNVRSKEDTIDFLQRPHKLGGMEIDGSAAQEIVEAFDLKKSTVILSESVASARDSSTPAAPQNDKSTVISTEPVLLREADRIQDERLQSKQIIEPRVSVDEMVRQICADTQFQYTDPAIQKRCLEIVTARVRNVRDALQTRTLLEQPPEAGGIGVSGRRLADMIERIERVVDAAEKEKRHEIEDKEKENRKKEKELENNRQNLIEKEAQVMAKRFVQATGKVPQERVAPAAPSLSRASAAVSAHMQLQQQEARIDTDKVRAAVQKTIKQELTPVPAQRPKVQDVQFERRLAGPIEELQAMSLTEFRRMSHDSSQAVDRIKDMIDLLEDQGYSKKVAGLQSLRHSPLMALYGLITQQALLSGTSVEAVLSTQKDKQGLKKAEYDALMKLNAELRF